MGSLLSGALSWLVVVTVGLAPMLIYWLARLIGQALLRKTPGPQAGKPASPEIPSPSEGEQTTADPSVKHRQGEAVRGKRLLSPLSIWTRGRRPSVSDPVTIAREISSKVSTTGDIAPWTICQIGPYRSSRLPLGSARGSPSSRLARSLGCSTAHCGRARKEKAGRVLSRRTENRLGFQLHG